MTSISLKNISKSFGEVEVIPPLDLEIEDGEFVVFVGPSGCCLLYTSPSPRDS